MKQNSILVGSSNFNEKREELLKAHEDFLNLNIQIKPRRPRIKEIKTPKKVVVSLGNVMSATLTMTWEQYLKHGQGLKIIMRIE